MRFFIELAYDGSDFHGWQKQPNAMSIQETLETCLMKIFQREMEVIGAGRTDAGVHAKRMIAHLDIEENFDPQHLIYKLNRMLPKSIVIHRIFRVQPEAHARFDAISRTYKYYISTQKDPFYRRFSQLITRELDLEKMNQACEIIMNHTDFQCFSKVKTDVRTFNCEIEKAQWEQKGSRLIFTIVADRFLRNMVRAIVGTMLEVGTDKISLSDLKEILKSKNRSKAGRSVEAKGLFLHRIVYPENIKLD